MKLLCQQMTIGRFCQFVRYVSTVKRSNPVSMAYLSFQSTKPTSVDHVSPIVIMHGLLGSKANWKSIGKAINARTGIDVYAVDARNHGDSPHTPDLNYHVLAEDLIYFLEEHSIVKAILMGHSMGGRAVMAAALLKPSVVEKLFVLDISPTGISENSTTIPSYLEIMESIDIPPNVPIQQARAYMDDLLKPVVSELSIRQFLLTNLIHDGTAYKWRVNLEAIIHNFNPHITEFPMVNSGNVYDGPTAFVGGSSSLYIRHEDHSDIRQLFPAASFHYLDGAGHWLHADKPREFLELIINLLV